MSYKKGARGENELFYCPDCRNYRGTWRGLSAHLRASKDCNRKEAVAKNQLIYAIEKSYSFCGGVPTRREMNDVGIVSRKVIEKYFGSYNKALQESDLEPNERKNIPAEDVLRDLKGLSIYLDKSPSVSEINEYCSFSSTLLKDRFGSINDAKGEADVQRVEFPPTSDEHYLYGVTGEDHPRYGDRKYSHSDRYKLLLWSKEVKQRDDYTCQECGSKENINAHHIKKKSEYPSLMFDVSNGIALCVECHAERHSGENFYQLLKNSPR